MGLLPSKFEDLEPLSEKWSKKTEVERNEARISSTQEELEEAYNILLKRAEDVIAYLNEFDLDEISGKDRNLLFLLLSFAEIAPAVEMFGQPTVPYGFDSRRFRPIETS